MKKILETISLQKSVLGGLLVNTNNRRVLADWLRTELAYTSNAVEGNTLSRRETTLAIDENITGGAKPIKDYIEARNHAAAYEFILESIRKKTPIDERMVMEIHRRILSGLDDENCGRYRNVRVRISGSNVILPNYMKVPDLMHAFGNWLKVARSDAIKKSIDEDRPYHFSTGQCSVAITILFSGTVFRVTQRGDMVDVGAEFMIMSSWRMVLKKIR